MINYNDTSSGKYAVALGGVSPQQVAPTRDAVLTQGLTLPAVNPYGEPYAASAMGLAPPVQPVVQDYVATQPHPGVGLPTTPATVMGAPIAPPVPVTMPAVAAAPYTTGAPAIVMPAEGVAMGAFSPATYTTDGGRSSMTGGYGSGSQLAAIATARRYGVTPAQMQEQKDLMSVAAARNSPVWNQMYQNTLSQTGNPNLAKSNADFQMALGTGGNYAASFATAAQDDAMQRGLAAQDQINAASMIDPNAASVNQNRFVPGGHVVGATPSGQPIYQAVPGGEATVLPMGGAVLPAISSGQIGARQRQADSVAQQAKAQTGRDIFGDALRLEQAQSRLDNAQLNNLVRNLGSQISSHLRNNQPVPPELQAQFDTAIAQQAGAVGVDNAAAPPKIQF